MSIYTLTYSDPNRIPSQLTLEIGQVDYTHDIALFGTAATEWAPDLQQGLLFLLENFAYSSPPLRPTYGQTWYDFSEEALKIYRPNYENSPSVDEWSIQDLVHYGPTEPQPPGKLWFDTSVNDLKIHTGNDYLSSPANIGSYEVILANFLRLSGGTITGSVTMRGVAGTAPSLTTPEITTQNLKIKNGIINANQTGLFVSDGVSILGSNAASLLFKSGDDADIGNINLDTTRPVFLKGGTSAVMFDNGQTYTGTVLILSYDTIIRAGFCDDGLILAGPLSVESCSVRNVGMRLVPNTTDAINRDYYNTQTATLAGMQPILELDGTNSMEAPLEVDKVSVVEVGGVSSLTLKQTNGDVVDIQESFIQNDNGVLKLINSSSATLFPVSPATAYEFNGTSHILGTDLTPGVIQGIKTTAVGDDTDGVSRGFATSLISNDADGEFNSAAAWGKLKVDVNGDLTLINSFNILDVAMDGNGKDIVVSFENQLPNENYIVILSPLKDQKKRIVIDSSGGNFDPGDPARLGWTLDGDAINADTHKGLWLYEVGAFDKTQSSFLIKTKVTSNATLDYDHTSNKFSAGTYVRRSRVMSNGAFSQKFSKDWTSPPRETVYNFVVYKT